MKLVAQVNELEKSEIEKIYERITSLKSLISSLQANNQLFTENSDMYEKIIDDLSSTQKKYNQWWSDVAKKYNLDGNNLGGYQVDFVEGLVNQLFSEGGDIIEAG